MNSRAGLMAVLLVGGAMVVVACSGTSAQGPAAAVYDAPDVLADAPSTTTGEESVSLKVVSFNTLYGAGYSQRFDEHIPAAFRGHSRVPQLMSFLEATRPDVLALEEAAALNEGSPSLAEQIAARFGMTYVWAPDTWELHVFLFSKYPIVKADYVSREMDFNGVALRATLRVSATAEVNVLAVHLNSMSSAVRTCQTRALLEIAAGGRPGPTILMGDMNFRPNATQFGMLTQSGWQNLALERTWPIDQVWLDPSTRATTGSWWEGVAAPGDISDHRPVGVDVTLTAASRDYGPVPERVETGRLAYACPMPQ